MKRWSAAILILSMCWCNPVVGQGVTQCGLELCPPPPPPPKPVPCPECERSKEQIEDGCSGDGVAYASGAAMRQSVVGVDWPDLVRKNAAAAALQSDWQPASRFLEAARAEPGLSADQTDVLTNLTIQMALEFGETDQALALLADAGTPAGLKAGLRSDRLFWWAMLAASDAPPGKWRDEIVQLLEQAYTADKTSFQVRVWRVRAWLEAAPWQQGLTCEALASDLTTTLLDLTEGSACPLMLGHIWHVTERALQRQVPTDVQSPQDVWLSFANGLVALLIGDGPVLDARKMALADAPARASCSEVALSRLVQVEKEVGQ